SSPASLAICGRRRAASSSARFRLVDVVPERREQLDEAAALGSEVDDDRGELAVALGGQAEPADAGVGAGGRPLEEAGVLGPLDELGDGALPELKAPREVRHSRALA